MRPFRLAAFIRNSTLVLLPLFAFLVSVDSAFALKLVSSTTMIMMEPNPGDNAYSMYRAGNGDIYISGNLGLQNVLARYTPDLVLVSSVASSSVYGEMIVSQSGDIYLASGDWNGQFSLVRYSPEMEMVSSMTVTMASKGRMKGFAIAPDGGLYVSGVCGEDTFGSDFKGYVVKLSSALSVISSTTIESGGRDYTSNVTVSLSGAVYGAFVTIGVPDMDLTLYRFDSALNPVSSAAFSWGGESYGGNLDVEINSTGDVFVCGVGKEVYCARFTSAPSFVSSGSMPVSPSYMAADSDGNVYLGGNSGSDMFIGKLSSNGILLSSVTYGGVAGGNNYLNGIAVDDAGNVFAAGSIASRIGTEFNTDLWVGKFDSSLVNISSVGINGEERDGFLHFDSVVLGPNGDIYVSGGGGFLGSGIVARYSPDLVLISSVTGFNSRYGILMDIDGSGDLYFRTQTNASPFGPSEKTIWKYDRELNFVSSISFNGCFYGTGKVKEVNGGIFIAAEEMGMFYCEAPVYIRKYDSNLVLQSTVPFAGAYGFYDIASDENGNLYPIGAGFPPGGGASVGVVTKYDQSLTFLSSVTVPSAPGGGSGTLAVLVSTASQRVFVGGLSGDDSGIWKYDYDLKMVSSVTFPGVPGEPAASMVVDMGISPDNNLMVAGMSLRKLWLARLTQELVLISSYTVDFAKYAYNIGTSVEVSQSGSIFLAGGSLPYPFSDPYTAWLGWFTYADEAGAQQGMAAGAPAFTGVSTGSFSAIWSSTYAANTLYYTQISTTSDFASVLASSSTYNKSAGFSDLAVNTTYYGRVYDPLVGAFVDLGSISTLANSPAAVAFDTIWQSSAAISWSANGNPDWTGYEVALWGAGTSTTTLSAVSTTTAVVPLPEGTTVYFGVRALNGGGTASEYATSISTCIQAAQTAVQAGVDKAVLYSGPSGDITASIPAGAFAQSVSVTIKTPAAWNVPAPTAGLLALNSPVNLEVTLDKPLQPSRNVEIIVSYRDSDLGARDESKLVLARYDEPHAAWVPLPSARDTLNNRITAVTRHFSLFQIMQVTPSATLTGVTVGPNPLKPSSNPGQSFTFRNLPADGRVRIYSYLGELLYEASADGSGMAVWDGRNKSGARVASGLYLALVQGAGDKKIMKLVIER